nr:MAG TPA: hypothetical protein [Caudoviricetes sp.]
MKVYKIRILCADGSETVSSVYFLISSKLFCKRINIRYI